MNRVFKNKITGDTHKIEINEFNRALDMETLASAHGLDISQWKFHSASMTVKGTCKTEIKSKGVNIEGLARQRDLNKALKRIEELELVIGASEYTGARYGRKWETNFGQVELSGLTLSSSDPYEHPKVKAARLEAEAEDAENKVVQAKHEAQMATRDAERYS